MFFDEKPRGKKKPCDRYCKNRRRGNREEKKARRGERYAPEMGRNNFAGARLYDQQATNRFWLGEADIRHAGTKERENRKKGEVGFEAVLGREECAEGPWGGEGD